jgi:hypothetical protein
LYVLLSETIVFDSEISTGEGPSPGGDNVKRRQNRGRNVLAVERLMDWMWRLGVCMNDGEGETSLVLLYGLTSCLALTQKTCLPFEDDVGWWVGGGRPFELRGGAFPFPV